MYQTTNLSARFTADQQNSLFYALQVLLMCFDQRVQIPFLLVRKLDQTLPGNVDNLEMRERLHASDEMNHLRQYNTNLVPGASQLYVIFNWISMNTVAVTVKLLARDSRDSLGSAGEPRPALCQRYVDSSHLP